jgi:uncharacterized membrane protein
MTIQDRRGLKAAASDALAYAPNAKQLVLLWAGVNTVLPLLVSVLNFILNTQIAQTGGLSGIGLRSILSTAQEALSSLTSLLLPFWNLGYTAAMLHLVRKQSTNNNTLLEGFRRFGPYLRLMLLMVLLFIAIGIAAFYVGITILSVTPLADPVYAVIDQSQSILSGTIDDATLALASQALMPIFFICCGLALLLLIPVFYRLRMAEFCLLDSPHRSARLVMWESRKMMRRNCLQLFQLDLSFWWFYLAQVLLMALCYGDILLPLLGITLPFSEDAAYFIFYIAALLAQFALLYGCSNHVQTTYAAFYDTLRAPEQEENPVMVDAVEIFPENS